MTDNPKLLSLLGMCRRAGKLSCGHDAAVGSLRSKSAKLCLLSSDSSGRLRKEIEREANFDGRSIPVRILFSAMDEIGHAAGLKSAVVTVNDEGFAKTMLGLLNTTANAIGEVNQ
ncbi:MAG: ribosomal L7Ae/L30e/S12e/Gadd45 family protein [Clostridia bacterium]|nr:ribosomal L7Ae/L30e/S12e/Gadd45 family protein [Clostridia bacterium]